MDDRMKIYFDMLTRVDRFGRTYVNYFVRTSFAGKLFAIVRASVDEIERLRRKQRSIMLTTPSQVLSRAVTKEILIREMDAIEMIANAIALDIPVSEDKFRAPRTYNDEKLLVGARAFAEDAVPLRDEFVRYAMPSSFIDDLNALIGEFEEAIAARTQGPGARLCVEAAIDDAMERALKAVRQLDAIMCNRFRDDNLGRTEWIMNSHVRYVYRASSAPGPND